MHKAERKYAIRIMIFANFIIFLTDTWDFLEFAVYLAKFDFRELMIMH